MNISICSCQICVWREHTFIFHIFICVYIPCALIYFVIYIHAFGVLMFGVNIHVQRIAFGVSFLHSQTSIEDLALQICFTAFR